MQTVRVNNFEAAFQIRGQGQPLLLVHGFPLDHSMWRFQFEVLATQSQVIAPDLRGYGRSSRGQAPLSMKQFADDLIALLDTLGIPQPIIFCGLSMGGYIGWELVRNYPERVSRLIQCDTRSIGDTDIVARGRRQMAARIIEQGPNGSALAADGMIPKLFSQQSFDRIPERVEQLRTVIANTDPALIAETQHALAQRHDATAWLQTMDVPTLLLCGQHDSISPPDEMRAIAEALPQASFEIIPDVGHMAPLEDPHTVNDLIRQFLSDF